MFRVRKHGVVLVGQHIGLLGVSLSVSGQETWGGLSQATYRATWSIRVVLPSQDL